MLIYADSKCGGSLYISLTFLFHLLDDDFTRVSLAYKPFNSEIAFVLIANLFDVGVNTIFDTNNSINIFVFIYIRLIKISLLILIPI